MEQLSYCIGAFICLIGYSSSDQYNILRLGENLTWNQAMQACKEKDGNMPEIRIIGHSLTAFSLVNSDLQNESTCFWLWARYTRSDNLTDEIYPNICCEVLFKNKSGTLFRECASCTLNYNYMCSSAEKNDNHWASNSLKQDTWKAANNYCNNNSHGLPSDDNGELLQLLQAEQSIWINVVRKINLKPKESDGTFDFCFCNGRIHSWCPHQPTAICILVTGKSETVKSSLDFRALIGGVIGAVSVVLIIIIILVVFLFKRSRRNKKTKLESKCPVNPNNLFKGNVHVNNAYEDVDEEFSDSVQHTSNQLQNFENKLYTIPTINEGYSVVKTVNDITIENLSSADMYSVIHKRQGIGQTLGNPKELPDVNEDENIKLGKYKQTDQRRDMYDKTDVHLRPQAAICKNVYNKGNISGEHHVNAENVYDKTNFHDMNLEDHTINVYSKANFSSEHRSCDEHVYDKAKERSKPVAEHRDNAYNKANFDRKTLEETTGNMYDKINLQ